MKRTKLNPRKLLIASIGVATVDYVAACGGDAYGVANLMAPPYAGRGGTTGYNIPGTVANLMAPPTVANLVIPPYPPTVANLVAPTAYPTMEPPPDLEQDAAAPLDAGDEVDAG
jgi:hypothetical protein